VGGNVQQQDVRLAAQPNRAWMARRWATTSSGLTPVRSCCNVAHRLRHGRHAGMPPPAPLKLEVAGLELGAVEGLFTANRALDRSFGELLQAWRGFRLMFRCLGPEASR